MNMVSLKPVIEELEVLFDKFNKAFFEGKLEKPVITVFPSLPPVGPMVGVPAGRLGKTVLKVKGSMKSTFVLNT